MKKSLYDILNNSKSNEFFQLIDEENFELPKEISLASLNAKVLNNIEMNTAKRRSRKRKPLFIIAASLAILVALGIGTVYALDVKEYNEAITYFNENHLSTEGLSRSEIKEVYHDISTETFSNSKTLEVLQNSKIKGYEIIRNDTNAEELRNLWDNNSALTQEYPNDVYYEYSTKYGKDKWMYDDEGYEFGYNEIVSSHISKMKNASIEWSVDFKEFDIDGYKEITGGVVVYGSTAHMYGEKPQRAWIALISDDGNVMWKCEIGDEFVAETVKNVTESNDQIAVFSSADNMEQGGINSYYEDKSDIPVYMMITVFDRNGNRLQRTKNKQDYNFVINNLTALEKGFLTEVIYYNDAVEIKRICKINNEGKIEHSYNYNSKGIKFEFADMLEYNGKIYISVISRPEKSIYDKIDDKISDEKLLPYVKEEFTAMLLECDSKSASPKKFYTVKGAFGGDLKTEKNGNMIWLVDGIVTSTYYPMTNAFSLSGLEQQFKYVFNNKGKLLSEEKTGKTNIYYVH